MSAYLMTWITENLAVGHAPMSYEELDSIREQGIVAIVNLCGEFSDLHEIEENAGFEVFWIPIPDETAPTMAEMEKGLEWLDESVYLGKKVLVHCHHGIGRTGTFVTAYLLRRGFGLKKAGKLLKSTRANPTNFSQWWLLRKFGKKEGQLKFSDPTPENRKSSGLEKFFNRYERLLEKVDAMVTAAKTIDLTRCCAEEKNDHCGESFSLELIEALYLHNKMNINLPAGQRQTVIERAGKGRKELLERAEKNEGQLSQDGINVHPSSCPLHEKDGCMLHKFRPIHCRLGNMKFDPVIMAEINNELAQLSSEVFEELFGLKIDDRPPLINSLDSVSGKFIQSYFQYLASRKNNES